MTNYWLEKPDRELLLPVRCEKGTLVKDLAGAAYMISYDRMVDDRIRESITDSTRLSTEDEYIKGEPYHPISPGPLLYVHRTAKNRWVVHIDPNGNENGNFDKLKERVYQRMEEYAIAFANIGKPKTATK